EVDIDRSRRIVVDAKSRRRATEHVGAARSRPLGVAAAVADGVVDEVEAGARGQNQLVAGHENAARDLEGVLRPGADRVNAVANVRLAAPLSLGRLLE